MESHKEDRIEPEPEIPEAKEDDIQETAPQTRRDDVVETAPEKRQDDIQGSEPEIQQDRIEKPTQEPHQGDVEATGASVRGVLRLSWLRLVFAYLTIADIVRSERVSRAWREAVQQYLASVENYCIQYSTSICKIPDRYLAFRSIILHERKGVIIEMVHKMGPYFVRVYSDCIDEEEAKALVIYCPKLEYLMLFGSKLKKYDERTEESRSEKRELTGMFLMELRTDLRTLGLSSLNTLKEECLRSAVSRLKGLTRLDLNFNSVETLQNVSSMFEHMPLLEHLSLTDYEGRSLPAIDPPCFDRLSHLRELHLWGNDFVTDGWVDAAAACERLRVLNVGACFRVTVKSVLALCNKRRGLTELVVANLSLSNATLKACLSYCKDLEYLDVSWCPDLTREVLTYISILKSRPILVRARSTDLAKANQSYEGLTLCTDITPRLYNPFETSFDVSDLEQKAVLDDRRMSAEDVAPGGNVVAEEGRVLDAPARSVIVIDRRDIHAEDDNHDMRAEHEVRDEAVHARGVIRAVDVHEEATGHARGVIRAIDVHEEATVQARGVIRAVEVHEEANVFARGVIRAVDVHEEATVHARGVIRAVDEHQEANVHARGVIRAVDEHEEATMQARGVIRAIDVHEEATVHARVVIRAVDVHEDDAANADDNNPREDEVRGEDDIDPADDERAENARNAENIVPAVDGLRAGNDIPLQLADIMHAENAAAIDVIRPEDESDEEDELRPVVIVPEEDVLRALDELANIIRPRGAMRVENEMRQEREIRPVVVVPDEDIIRARGDFLLPLRRPENGLGEERIPQQNLIQAEAIVHEPDDINEQNGQENEIYQNGLHPEDFMLPEDEIMADDEMDDDDDEFRVRVQEIDAAAARFAEDGVLPDNDPGVFVIQPAEARHRPRARQNGDHERDMRVLDRMYEEYGLANGAAPANGMWPNAGNGVNAADAMNEGHGMDMFQGMDAVAPERNVFENDLFMNNGIMEDEDDDQV